MKKYPSIAVITAVFCIAALAGLFVFHMSADSAGGLWALWIADIAATVVVWIFGLIFKNVSVYDPYWSVAPPVMFTAWAVYKSCFTLPVVLLLVAVWYWGIRLTGNWVYTFKGMAHEDWRYTRYRETQPPFVFHLINFFGLNMMPTLLVFACMVPGFHLFGTPGSANGLTWLGFIVCLASATIQLVADTQAHRFRNAHPGAYCSAGLWKSGRHPNYFGEVQMWWGVWLMYASIHGIDLLILAPVAMTALFLFISIPMMERRQLERKPGYAEYRKKTRILI